MSGREAILGNIRKGLKRSGPLAGTALELCQTRLREHRPNLIPARAQLPHAGQVELFVQMALEASATVARTWPISRSRSSAWRAACTALGVSPRASSPKSRSKRR